MSVARHPLLRPDPAGLEDSLQILSVAFAFLKDANVALAVLVFINFVVWNVLVDESVVPFFAVNLLRHEGPKLPFSSGV